MNGRTCPQCNNVYLDSIGCCKNANCPYFLGNGVQSVEPSNFDDPSHHSDGQEFSSEDLTGFDHNDIATVCDIIIASMQGKNSTEQSPSPNQAGCGGQPALPDNNELYRNFENTTNQVESNVQENSWNSSGEPMPQGAPACQWTNQGQNWNCYAPSTSQGNSVSHPTFGNISQARQINPSQQQPVAAPNHSPIAATSSKGFKLAAHSTGYYGPGNQSGQIAQREDAQHSQRNTRDSATIQAANLTQQPLAAYVPIRTLEIGASGPLSSLESIAQNQKSHSLQEPEAGASDSGQNPIGNSTRIVSEPSGSNNPGFCVMCEEDFKDIHAHWREWHYIQLGVQNPCYQVYEHFGATFLIPHFTHDDELQKCPTCKFMFFKLRSDDHGCPVSSSRSAEPIANFAPVLPSGLVKLEGYCLMCQFTFPDVWSHRFQFHKGNAKYTFKNVYGIMALLPDETSVRNELGQCTPCWKIKYKKKLSYDRINHTFYCPPCFLIWKK